MMKLYVDDIRNAPDDSWMVERTITSAIRALDLFAFDVVSLDHDISHQVAVGSLSRPFPCDETFEAVARYMAQMFPTGGKDIKVILHTSNPVGAKAMEAILEPYYSVEIKPMGAANRLEMTT